MLVFPIIILLPPISILCPYTTLFRSQTQVCINNLRQIDSAKQQWALETRQATNATPVVSDIAPYLGRSGAVTVITTTLVCPAGGTTANFGSSYTINSVSEAPTCQILTTTHLLQ